MIIKNITEIKENYYEIDALSNSYLKLFAKSPAHTKIKYKTDALDFGTAMHNIILEKKEYYVYEKLDGRKADGKAQKIEIDSKIEAGELVIEKSDYEIIKALQTELLTRKIDEIKMSTILENGVIEQGYLAECEIDVHEFKLKIKPDTHYETEDEILILDLKSCVDVGTFFWDVKKYKYDWQAHLYSEVIMALTGKPSRFIFVAMEKSFPHGVKLFEVDSPKTKLIVEDTITEWLDWKLWGADTNIKYKNEIETLYL